MENRIWLGRRRLAAALSGVAVVFTLGLLSSKAALASDGDVVKRAGCSGGSTAKLKLSHEDGGIEIEFEVDQNRSGVPWRVLISRPGGAEIFAGRRVTRPPSGSFEVRRVTANRPGADTIRARAVSPGGEVCRVVASMAGAAAAEDGGGASSDGSTSGGSTSGADDSGSGGHGSDD